jgi:hypothetical protein
MNWIKTYESFIHEGSTPNSEVDKFEDIIDFTKGTGIITAVMYDDSKKILSVELLPKLNSFDIGGVMNAVDKSKAKIKKEYPGVKQLRIGAAVINL